jgi:hypothetical protein
MSDEIRVALTYPPEIEKKLDQIINMMELHLQFHQHTNKTETIKREIWSVGAVAREFDIKDKQTVINWIKNGDLPATKNEFSGRWEIPNSSVEMLRANGGKPQRKK